MLRSDKRLIYLVFQLSRERAAANSRTVRLCDAEDVSDGARRQAEASADAANGARTRCDKWIRPVVQIQHCRVRAFHEDIDFFC